LSENLAATARIARDGVNAILFREDAWCYNGDERLGCYDHQAQAVTSVFVREGGGNEIVEVDIEINAAGFHWTVDGASPADPLSNARDLQTTVVHEIGHALGLAHVCDDGQFRGSPKDKHGRRVPSCGKALTAPHPAIMYPEAGGRYSVRRDLSPDERQSVCDIYPARSKIACSFGTKQGDESYALAGAATVLWAGFVLAFARSRSCPRRLGFVHHTRSRARRKFEPWLSG
jgi:hypothetical protein